MYHFETVGQEFFLLNKIHRSFVKIIKQKNKNMHSDKLSKQINFIKEIDKIKYIQRRTKLFNSNRHENDAEHSWHLAMMAIVLAEHSNTPIDILKVIKMVLIHDIVEIDTGDVILSERVAIAEDDSAGDLHNHLMDAGAGLLVRTVKAIADGNYKEQPQAVSVDLKHAPKIFKEFCKIDWNKPFLTFILTITKTYSISNGVHSFKKPFRVKEVFTIFFLNLTTFYTFKCHSVNTSNRIIFKEKRFHCLFRSYRN